MSAIRVAVDVVILAIREGKLQVLLVKRRYAPFQGRWAIPGGFVKEEESLESAAQRELEEETGVRDVYLEQLYSFGDPGRDPRGRIVSVCYFALLSSGDIAPKAGTDAADAGWFAAFQPPPLAFDHARILDYALLRLRYKLEWTTAGFQLLPKKFTLTDIQKVYEAVLNKRLDKRNFRRKLALLDVLEPLHEYRSEGAQRPARLHRFSAKKFELLKDKGILFPF
ncbi:MAG TPA: NUDIX hydrolase [Elusimicrobia bacterium]|nr:NUDIX hydrolase [Elusimicrobiota bacterium]